MPLPAHGILLDTAHASFRGTTQLFGMQMAQTAADSGGWMDTRHIKDGAFEFCNDGNSGGSISAFSAQVMASNSLKIPSNATDGTALGSAVTALGMVALASTARWIKVKVNSITVSGGATLGVRLHSHNY